MSEIESLVNSLRGMELPKGAESLLSTILGKSNTLESDKDSLKKALDKREGENKTARDAIKTLETERDDLKTKLPGDGSRVLPKAEAERYDAYTALNLKPDEIKTQLEQASQDRQAVLTASNKEALATLGLKPSLLNWRQFDGAVLSASKDKDGKVTATVKTGETEAPWEQFVKDKGLEGDLKDFAAQAPGVQVLPQYQGSGSSGASSTSKHVDDLNAARQSRPNPLLGSVNNSGDKK